MDKTETLAVLGRDTDGQTKVTSSIDIRHIMDKPDTCSIETWHRMDKEETHAILRQDRKWTHQRYKHY
jgi:hypothetical protein